MNTCCIQLKIVCLSFDRHKKEKKTIPSSTSHRSGSILQINVEVQKILNWCRAGPSGSIQRASKLLDHDRGCRPLCRILRSLWLKTLHLLNKACRRHSRVGHMISTTLLQCTPTWRQGSSSEPRLWVRSLTRFGQRDRLITLRSQWPSQGRLRSRNGLQKMPSLLRPAELLDLLWSEAPLLIEARDSDHELGLQEHLLQRWPCPSWTGGFPRSSACWKDGFPPPPQKCEGPWPLHPPPRSPPSSVHELTPAEQVEELDQGFRSLHTSSCTMKRSARAWVQIPLIPLTTMVVPSMNCTQHSGDLPHSRTWIQCDLHRAQMHLLRSCWPAGAPRDRADNPERPPHRPPRWHRSCLPLPRCMRPHATLERSWPRT